MNIQNKYKIQTNSDLLFAKIDISNYLKKNKPEYVSFFSFTIMELGTNLIKYASGGEIWLIKSDDEYLLASLDSGGGIEDLKWSMQNGTSTKKSLGLGLYQLSHNSFFDFNIFSDKDFGTVVLIKPTNLNNRMVVLNENYIGLNVSGDFFVKKGRFFMLGDASGHGLKANKSANFIKKYFLNNIFSCIFIDDFYKDLHKELKANNLRSAVITIGELNRSKLSLCGVGNIGFIHKENDKIEHRFFKDGIIGEAFSSASKYSYKFTSSSNSFVFSDGIDEKLMYNISSKIDDIYLSVICAIYYSQRVDDKIILAIRSQNE